MMTALSTTKTVPSSVTPSRKQPGVSQILSDGKVSIFISSFKGKRTGCIQWRRLLHRIQEVQPQLCERPLDQCRISGDGRTPTVGSAGISWEFTDYMIEDGSFVALRDVVLGYTFDKKKLKKAGLNSLRLYASGQNLLYFWGKSYRGINPEARVTTGSYSSPLVNGYQRGGFPIQSTVNIGFELNF